MIEANGQRVVSLVGAASARTRFALTEEAPWRIDDGAGTRGGPPW